MLDKISSEAKKKGITIHQLIIKTLCDAYDIDIDEFPHKKCLDEFVEYSKNAKSG